MLRGQVTIPLAPSIRIGTRFRYTPFKNALPDDAPWDFYVEEVTHRFVFGGQSSTTLALTRGLPSSVYADSGSGGLLRAVYTGNARRQDGLYVPGLPAGTGEGLQVFSTQENSNSLAGQMSATYVTPQYPSQ